MCLNDTKMRLRYLFLNDTRREGDLMRKKLKEIRLKKGFTHKSLAETIGIDRASYTNIELGKKNPSFSLVMKIKKALEYENDDIFLNQMCLKETNFKSA